MVSFSSEEDASLSESSSMSILCLRHVLLYVTYLVEEFDNTFIYRKPFLRSHFQLSRQQKSTWCKRLLCKLCSTPKLCEILLSSREQYFRASQSMGNIKLLIVFPVFHVV
ncbi:hypothetical protein ILYODFUR_033937 [Ilyodon furcidens]|uniref:Uncharacterized protein n=1 Tax=Ilyodon furcidens TaxID=33524 RepID=A0ABV0V8E6_9TELE